MLDNNRDLQWFGCCGRLSQEVVRPTPIKLSDHFPELFNDPGSQPLLNQQQTDFAVVKVTASWSRSMSVTNVLIADLRQVNLQNPWKKINNAIQVISQKWEPRDGK